MPIVWNVPLVVLSVMVAIFGSFTALIHVKRMRESTGRGETVWMVTGGFTLGLSIWAMHFIGMLAFHVSTPLSYDLQLTLLSSVPALLATLLGFYLLREKRIRWGRVAGGGLIMGLGISLMHYSGMAALKMSPPLVYDPWIFSVSIAVAVLTSYGAFFVVYAGEKYRLNPLIYYSLGGLIMGLAISGMHYTAMSGTHIPAGSVCLGGASPIDPALLTLFVAVSIFLLLGAGMFANMFDQRYALQTSQTLSHLQKLHGELEAQSRSLNDSAARIQAILDTVIDGIITINEYGIVETVNPASEAIFGYAAAEVVGRNISMLMPEPYRSQHDGYLASYMAGGEKKIIGIGREVVGRRKDGSTFPMDLAVSEMTVGGRKMFTGIVRDITERKEMERMKSEFVSTVSHELRTPLTSIRGALGLVIGKFGSSLPDKARYLLETANRNSERLTFLINDILDLEKIESGRLEFEFRGLDLVAVAQQALIANEGYGQQHGVHLRLVEAPARAMIWGDEHRLLQVFANLLSNAVKYSELNAAVEVSVHRQDGRYRVGVRNYGRGIPAQFRSRIFQRFAQADSSDTREKGGTGLGLSITKAIVERHGGTLDFISEEGACTEFFFDLPAWLAAVEKAPATDSRPHMLICEDNPDVSMVLSELLEHEGVSSDRAATAAVALDMLKRNRYHGLLLDLGLPDMDGLALLKQLRSDAATRELPVIVVTGRTREEDKAWKGGALAVYDWLQKPVDRESLSQAVANVIRHYERPRILHVEDDIDIIQVSQALLEEESDYHYALSLAAARHELEKNRYDLLLLDLSLPDGSGLELLEAVGPDTKVIVFTGENSNALLKQHVSVILTKSTTSNQQLLATIKRVISQEKDFSL